MNTGEQTVDDADDLDPVAGDVDHDDLDDAPDAPTEAIVGELARQAEQYAAAEQAEKLAEGVEADRDEHVFDGPYNADAAMKVILESYREVADADAEWKQSAEQTKAFKKTYDESVKRQQRLLKRFDEKRRDSQQPFLKTLSDDERNGETIDLRRRRLSQALQVKRFYVTPHELAPLVREDLDTLDDWLPRNGPVPPALLARAHVAGDPGEMGSFCTRCGATLGRVNDNTDYPRGAFVRLDCPGDFEEEVLDTPEPRSIDGTKRLRDLMKCDPQGRGKNEYGHVWSSSDPGALCQCGRKLFGGGPAKTRETKRAPKKAHTQPRKRR